MIVPKNKTAEGQSHVLQPQITIVNIIHRLIVLFLVSN